ncbi:MAG TPA: CHASE2 domain-containing protein, partial [Armatimonadota bacterium]|nr:CHASE2 domain-containing protein [Armatimonadota bacterium]
MRRTTADGRFKRGAIWMALGVFGCIAILSGFGRLRGTENALLGMRFDLRRVQKTTDEVIILALEQALPEAGGMPGWPMADLAGLVRRLDAAGARIIVLDVPELAHSFRSIGEVEGERELADAMQEHGMVVLPMHVDSDGEPNPEAVETMARYVSGQGELDKPHRLSPGFLATPSPLLAKAAAAIGANNVYQDTDGVLREAPLAISWQGDIYPALWTEVVRVADGLPPGSLRLAGGLARLGERRYQVSGAGEALVNYRGEYLDFPRVAYQWAIEMEPEQLADLVGGKIVMVGSDFAGAATYFQTPTAPMMPGVEVAANVLDNLLAGDTLSRPAAWARYLAALLLCLLTAWLLARAGPLLCLVLTL